MLLAASGSVDGDGTTQFRYQRAIVTPSPGPACATLDAAVLTHASGTLADLRIYPASRGASANATTQGQATEAARPLPFFLTVSGTEGRDSDPASLHNVQRDGPGLSFDLLMPPRAYTDVVLDVASRDFAAEAHVYAPGKTPAERQDLGEFAIFDLSTKGLPRSTTLRLQETSLPEVHVLLMPLPGTSSLDPGMLRGATVPPSRSAQTLYTTAASTTSLQEQGTDTVAQMLLPARLPVEQVRFVLKPGTTGNFSREVTVSSHPENDPGDAGEVLSGRIGQLHQRRGDVMLTAEQLTVAATLGANLQSAATVRVAIRNGSAPPLPVQEVALEMRRRQICFKVPTGVSAVRLFYGGAAEEPTRSDAGSSTVPSQPAQTVTLGPEERNSGFRPRVEDRSLRSRHPRLLYLGTILLVCGLALIALRSSRLRA